MSKIPSLAELQLDHTQAYANDEYNLLCSQPPPESWLKKHPMTGHKYLPIDKVEFLLIRIFQFYRTEIKNVQVVLNSIVVTVRLHYKLPESVGGEWTYQDGIGAKEFQLDSGSKASEIDNIKSFAVAIAAPIAKEVAFKDAADKIGTLFGKDLNRKDTIQFEGYFTGTMQKPQIADAPPAASPVVQQQQPISQQNSTPAHDPSVGFNVNEL